jgi:YHS domain-containing protein
MKAQTLTMFLVVSLIGAAAYAGEKKHAQKNHQDHAHGAQQVERTQSEPAAQSVCPVMGGAIDSSIYVDHDGKRVYFCCEGCVGQFKENPEKYLEKLEAMGQKPETIEKQSLAPQKTCPVMGGAINKALYADHAGKRVYFCCQGCIEPFREDPATYLKKLAAMGEAAESVDVAHERDG